jgi:hypothetical protein
MSNEFTSYLSKDVGLTPVAVLTVAAQTTTTVIGATAANLVATPIQVSAYITRSSVNYYIVKSVDIPVGSSLVISGGDQKIVMIAGDQFTVVSNTAASIDSIVSVLNVTEEV